MLSQAGALAAKLRDFLREEIKSGELLRALAVIGPLVIAYLLSREPAMLNLGLLAVSLLIPALKLRLAPRSVALHFPRDPLHLRRAVSRFPRQAAVRTADRACRFPCCCRDTLWRSLAYAGQLGVYPRRLSRLRTARRGGRIGSLSPCRRDGGSFADFTGAGLRGPDWRPASSNCAARPRTSVGRLTAAGRRDGDSVFAAAALVGVLNLAQGQWVIWSAASVVVGDLTASTGKLKQRAIGALVGVPLGFLVGAASPESQLGYSLAVLGATLTLLAFSRYTLGFGSRCFFVALAAAFTGGASGIAEERVTNVIAGGAFGLIAVALMEFVWRRVARKAAGQSPPAS